MEKEARPLWLCLVYFRVYHEYHPPHIWVIQHTHLGEYDATLTASDIFFKSWGFITLKSFEISKSNFFAMTSTIPVGKVKKKDDKDKS